jgi:hypothetical protein
MLPINLGCKQEQDTLRQVSPSGTRRSRHPQNMELVSRANSHLLVSAVKIRD